MFFSALTLILNLTSKSSQLVLNCDEFSTIAFYDTFEYLCESTNIQITTKSEATITEIFGAHEVGQSNNDVTILWIYDTNCQFFPQSIEIFLPKLISIQIVNTSLSEIHREDLKPHQNLQFLMLTNNNIEIIEPNLFEDNKMLKFLDLSNNKIKIVNVNAFSSLIDLNFFYFINNPCLDDAAQDDKDEVKKLINKICCSCKLKLTK